MNKTGSFFIVILLLTMVPLIHSCSEGDLSIGDRFVDTDTYTAIVDTFSLELSTIKMDSVETSATGTALAGYVRDDISATKSVAFFQIVNETGSVNQEEKFDSLCLVLNHNGFYEGDTSALYTLNVHRVTGEIETNTSGSLCNYNHFEYATTPLATYRYKPEPAGDRTITIRMDDNLGRQLLDTLQTSSNLTTSEFTDWFKGLALVPDTTTNKAILGYEAAEDSAFLRLYTHRMEQEKIENYFDFPLSETSLQFNHIKSYPVAEPLEKLDSYKKKVREDELDGRAVLEAGTGYFTRIDIPGLKSMKALRQEGRIVKANLIVGVSSVSFENKELPETIYLLEADKINQVAGYVINNSENVVTGTLNGTSSLYEKERYYSFDITYFLNALVDEEITAQGTGMLLAFAEEDLKGSSTKIVFTGYDHPSADTRLSVFYYYFDIEE